MPRVFSLIRVSVFFCTIGFSCYWLSGADLWRITECYFDVYNTWHYWSNVACVHRSYLNLAERMEIRFNKTLEKEEIGSVRLRVCVDLNVCGQ